MLPEESLGKSSYPPSPLEFISKPNQNVKESVFGRGKGQLLGTYWLGDSEAESGCSGPSLWGLELNPGRDITVKGTSHGRPAARYRESVLSLWLCCLRFKGKTLQPQRQRFQYQLTLRSCGEWGRWLNFSYRQLGKISMLRVYEHLTRWMLKLNQYTAGALAIKLLSGQSVFIFNPVLTYTSVCP